MPKTPAKHKLADLSRAVKAAAQSPLPLAIEIRPDGTIVLVPAPETVKKPALAIDPGHAL
jgi:hypothetical protein